MIRISYATLQSGFQAALVNMGFDMDTAQELAGIFADNQRDGVYSHGLNRFLSLRNDVSEGRIDIHAKPVKVHEAGALEQWDARGGPGPLNARMAMRRACSIAEENGIGMVALRNSNHWMRGGTYGLQAVDAGFIGLCWTNAKPIMRPWGGADVRTGNNPLIIAIPTGGAPLLLDMALTQFSMGKIEMHRLTGHDLPCPGGYDEAGNLTKNPHAIKKSRNPLPIGLWKGTGLSMALDLLAALLSGGNATRELGEMDAEALASQVFIAIDPQALGGTEKLRERAGEILAYYQETPPENSGDPVRYPGQGMYKQREENMKKGIPVDPGQWETLRDMGKKT